MALTRTLGEIVDAIQRTADVLSFTDRHPVAYIRDLACRGIAALDRIIKTTDAEFRPLGSVTITTDGNNSLYPLPVDCRSIISVSYTVDGKPSWIEPYEWAERALLADTSLVNVDRAYGYKRIGANIEILPVPPADQSLLIWYATTSQQPSSDGTSVDVYDRLDDYIIWYAAREIADERENWARSDRLGQKMAALEADIRILARSRDISASPRIPDRRTVKDAFGRRRFWR